MTPSEYRYLTEDMLRNWDKGGSSQFYLTARALFNGDRPFDDVLEELRLMTAEVIRAGMHEQLTSGAVAMFFASLYRETTKRSGAVDESMAAGHVAPDSLEDPLLVPSIVADGLWTYAADLEFRLDSTFLRQFTPPVPVPAVLEFPARKPVEPLEPTAEGRRLEIIIKEILGKNFIPNVISRERLEYRTQQKAGLIAAAEPLQKKEVRSRTAMLYLQEKYNLLREESEGYSRLLVLLADSLPDVFDPYPPADGVPAMSVEEAVQRRTEAVEEKVWAMNERMTQMTGRFDLDPNRILDVALDAFAVNISDHWDYFVRLIEVSKWGPTITMENGKPVQKPNRICGQILGFKFDWYNGSSSTRDVPESLIFVAAVLIKHGLVNLEDLFPHLSPTDERLTALYEQHCRHVLQKRGTAGRFKGPELAGTLGDDGRVSTAKATGLPSLAKDTRPQPLTKVNQKAELATALVAIGDTANGLKILNKLPDLVHLHPDLADAICRHLSIMLQDWDTSPIAHARQVPKPSPEDFRPGTNTIILRLAPPFLRVTNGRKPHAPRYRFFYRNWHASVTRCNNVGEVIKHLRSYFMRVGVHLHRDPLLLATILRIGARHITESQKRLGRPHAKTEPMDIVEPLQRQTSERKEGTPGHGAERHTSSGIPAPSHVDDPFEGVDLQGVLKGWINLIINHILPAISRSEPNPANSLGLWNIIKHFPYQQRFAMYGEWGNIVYNTTPEMQLVKAGCERDCKYILSRLNKESAKQSGRQIGKVLHSNPVVAFSYIITRLEAYDNMIPFVVDATRYLTELEFDIMPYCLIEALADPKSKVQRNGLNVSDWLKSLGTFTGQSYRKHQLDLEPMLRYLINQLCDEKLHDLHILQELISSMSGVKTMEDVTEAQLEAIAGTDTLKREALIWEPMRLTRKSGLRLMKAMVDGDYVRKIAVRISQLKQQMPYSGMGDEDDSMDLKILASMTDYCQRTLLQMLEFLSVTCPPDMFVQAMPDVGVLVNDYGLEPEQAFLLARQKLAQYVKYPEAGETRPEPPRDPNAMQVDEPRQTEKDNEQVDPASKIMKGNEPNVEDVLRRTAANVDFGNPVWQLGLHDTIRSVVPMLPASVWRPMSPAFYVTFWQLSLFDIFVPDARYDAEIAKQRDRAKALELKVKQLSSSQEDEAKKLKKDIDRCHTTKNALEADQLAHQKHHKKVITRLEAESVFWFENSVNRNDTTQAVIQYCIQPRCTQSAADAVFCAKFVLLMHKLGTPSIPTVTLYDKVFAKDVLHADMFSGTEDEAKNYGLFLAVVFASLSSWHNDKALFQKEAIGEKLPGFLKRWPPGAPNGKLDLRNGDWIDYDEFRQVLRKWHLKLSKAITACVASTDYMQIRNAIFILDKVNNYFPATKEVGNVIDFNIKKLLEIDPREDVKQLARSVGAKMGAKASTWVNHQDFCKGADRKLNPAAAPFVPSALSMKPTPVALVRERPAPSTPREAPRAPLREVLEKPQTPQVPIKREEPVKREVPIKRDEDREPQESKPKVNPPSEVKAPAPPVVAKVAEPKERPPPEIKVVTKSPPRDDKTEVGEIRRVELDRDDSAHDSREPRRSRDNGVKVKEYPILHPSLPARPPPRASGINQPRRDGSSPLPSSTKAASSSVPSSGTPKVSEKTDRPSSSVLDRLGSKRDEASGPSRDEKEKDHEAARDARSKSKGRDGTGEPESLLSVVMKDRDPRKDEKRGSNGRERDKDRSKDRDRDRKDKDRDRDRKRKEREDSTVDDKRERKRDRGDKEDREAKRSRREDTTEDPPAAGGGSSSAQSSSRKRHAEDDPPPPPGGIDSYRPGSGPNKRLRESPRERPHHRDRDDRRRRSSGR
ncbi:transcription factor/nuclear export subunit protein 2-domain-containing protein [Fimicolochytrium jonesii]|uniref:transcription factor/nuclear export subunit protein 2-domain-containing protein n=1 Tax=Fimicolochytrium jonesii TaxID=1396493 RepID=UPI0022FDFF51|nr:transcription factor/nuclear export subunit protein 2-domain-containing protein [Fimicolochytrium jonesii]KAI8819369.1 transcription factor/nuclear export subunit protein 2-domain-containing protein [Fimicolochytrium jonesii]